MAALNRITQVFIEADIDSASSLHRITQLLAEVDINTLPMPCKITQIFLEVDILEAAAPPTGRKWGPAANIM